MGTLATLPFATVGSYVLAPAGSALAEEADESEVDGGDAKGPSLKIIAAKPYETSFIVADMADGAQTAVKGAKVKVTRQDGKGSAEGVTDDKGIAIIDIAKIANNPNGNKDVYKMSSYVLAGSISVTASGYRDFEVGLTYVEGGQLIEVPTRKLSENLPYPACATIAGWDMLYTKNDFLLDSANTANVDAKVVVKNLGAGECTLSLTHGKTGEAFAQAKVTPTGGVATAVAHLLEARGQQGAQRLGREVLPAQHGRQGHQRPRPQVAQVDPGHRRLRRQGLDARLAHQRRLQPLWLPAHHHPHEALG